MRADAARFAQIPGVVTPLPPPIPSDDGQALQVVVPVDDAEGEEIGAVVEQLRDITGGDRDGLTVDVSGPAGLLADLIEVFSAIDGPLLLVTLVVVLVILLIVYRSPVLLDLPAARRPGCRTPSPRSSSTCSPTRTWSSSTGRRRASSPCWSSAPAPTTRCCSIARYREELHRHERPWDAMKAAWTGAAPAIIASGGTVIVSLLCLLLSEPQLQPGARPGRRHRHRRHPAGDAHLPARAAGARRTVGVLALPAPSRPGRPAGRSTASGAASPASSARHARPIWLTHRRRAGPADPRPHPARRRPPSASPTCSPSAPTRSTARR